MSSDPKGPTPLSVEHKHCWCQNYNVAANAAAGVGTSSMKMQEQCCWCGVWRAMPDISTTFPAATNENRKHGPHKRYFCSDPNHATQATEIAALKEEITKADRKFLEVEASWEKRQNALLSEIAALKGALEEAEERISLLEDGLRGMKSYTGSAEALQYVRRVLAGKEAQGAPV